MAFQNGVQDLHDRHAGLEKHQHLLVEGEQGTVVYAAPFEAFCKQKLEWFLFDLKNKKTLLFKTLLQHPRLSRLEFPVQDFSIRCTKLADIKGHNLFMLSQSLYF